MRDAGEKARAAFGSRIPELAAGGVGLEGGFVGGRLERALVVVEPPGEARIGREAEVDHRVLVSHEDVGAEELAGAVGHAFESEVVDRLYFLPIEAEEGGGGGDAVEAVVVEAELEGGHLSGGI